MDIFVPAFTQNVVARAELKHQRFVISNSRSGTIWIALALVMLVPALLASLAYTVFAMARPFAPALVETLVNTPLGGNGFWLMLIMNIALYPVVTLVTLGLSANSITREKRGRTWDHLRLTGVSAMTIVRGKWWATLRALLGDHVMVMLLRMGLVAVAAVWFPSLMHVRWPAFPEASPVLGLPPELVHVPLLALITLVYTVLDAGFTGALGIIISLPESGGPVIVTLALTLRILATAASLALMVVTFAVLFGGGLLYVPLSLVGWVVYGVLIWALLRVARALVG